LNILEQRFDLAEGAIQLQGALTPFLRFVAETETDTATVQVILEGLADDLAVTFSSNPEKPEDEVLALLLFGRSLSQVSAFQALQLANAVAVLAGRGGSGIIGSLRESFGLDDIDVDTREDGTAEVRVGKYISENAYTDVTVDGTGNTEVSINVDLTPSLTARGSVGASGSSSIGLFFERDY
jgi:translocation and assembly module TamB